MHDTGYLESIGRNLDGDLTITLRLENTPIDDLTKLKGKHLTVDIKQYREKRSNKANKYLWELLDAMAKVLKSDKYTVYLMQLSKYGVFVDADVYPEAIPALEQAWRLVEIFDDGYETHKDKVTVRCFLGSSWYDTKQMSDLIDGTVSDAKDLGLDTLTPDEIAEMMALYEQNGGNK